MNYCAPNEKNIKTNYHTLTTYKNKVKYILLKVKMIYLLVLKLDLHIKIATDKLSNLILWGLAGGTNVPPIPLFDQLGGRSPPYPPFWPALIADFFLKSCPHGVGDEVSFFDLLFSKKWRLI